VAVNPETRLAALARTRGWLVEHWSKARGAPWAPLPLAPRWGGSGRDGLLTRFFERNGSRSNQKTKNGTKARTRP
jgi:hypothetical protein